MHVIVDRIREIRWDPSDQVRQNRRAFHRIEKSFVGTSRDAAHSSQHSLQKFKHIQVLDMGELQKLAGGNNRQSGFGCKCEERTDWGPKRSMSMSTNHGRRG